MLMFLVPDHLSLFFTNLKNLVNRISFAVLSRGGTRPTFLSVAADKGEGYHPFQLDVVGSRGS